MGEQKRKKSRIERVEKYTASVPPPLRIANYCYKQGYWLSPLYRLLVPQSFSTSLTIPGGITATGGGGETAEVHTANIVCGHG